MVLGLAFTALGLVGALVPLMPTTVFLILAAGCFARSSPRLEAWLLNHPRFGAALRGWRRHRAVPRRAKQMAVTGMTAGYVLFELAARPPLWLAVVVALLLIACAAWLISRPTPPSVSETCP
ncbi:YbaN family protein [Brevundimonas sp.]|uniref:YbaN family protein n=1 Tax=Brevundimonas sp. TaxID=1871086 RepID=UPI0025876C06|nr:YbaN family protein [Brevundimonas sp.]